MSIFSLFKKPEVMYSKINGTVSIGSSFGKKALFVERVPQSGGEFVYMWNTVIKTLVNTRFSPRSVLLLGVAGGTVLDSLYAYYPEASITGIELDDVIITAAKKGLGLKDNPQTNIVIADAIKWVKNPSKKRYDLIIVDLYLGALNPKEARTKSFLTAVKKLLTLRGKIIYNSDYQGKNARKYIHFKNLCRKEFKKVEEIFSYKLNRILLMGNY